MFRRAYVPVWLAVCGWILSLVFVERQNRIIHLQNARADVQYEVGILRSRLEGYLNADLQLVKGLIAVVATNTDIEQDSFSEIATRAIGGRSEFVNVAIAPNMVVEMVYPYEANKSVIGFDYKDSPAQRDAAFRVRDTQQMVFAGPVNLIQGGRGFIGRFPIIVDDAGTDKFWGLAAVVLDADLIYLQTGILDAGTNLQIALVGRDGKGADGELFFGNPNILNENPVITDIILPAGSWQLAAIPKGGWPTRAPNTWALRMVMIGVGALVVFLIYLACRLTAIGRDVSTTLSERELELQRNQEELQRLSAVAEHASDSIVLTGPDGQIIWVNDAFTEMTEYKRLEAVGKMPGDLLNGPHTDTAVIDQIIAHRDRGEPFRTEILNYTKSKREIWVDTRLVPVLDKNGEITMVIGIERDISQAKMHELEMAEAMLAAKTADRAKSEFLANMSHEIRTPMNGIIGMADILAEADLSQDDRQCLDTIRSSSAALLKIINDILDLSRLESGQLSVSEVEFELSACVDAVADVLRPSAQAKGIDIEISYDEAVPRFVCTDDGRLRQILLNLAGNAVKFTDRGYVCLDVRCDEDDPYNLIVSVKDTGIGMSAEDTSGIFDRFRQADTAITRSYGGTGLGLTISRRLAEQMGGGITVVSELGHGSCFTLELQTKAPASEPLNQTDPPFYDPSIIEGQRVLLAEDNRTNRLLIRKFLSGLSVELLEAENGQLAVEMCDRHHPDIILMDMSMPIMDGITATKRIRNESGPQPLIIALTANAFPDDREACLAAGMDGFLSKPVKKDQLLDAMAAKLVVGRTESNQAGKLSA